MSFDGTDDVPEPRRRRPFIKAIAVVLIVALVLTFPLGYLLNEEMNNRHVEAFVAIVEVVIAAVLLTVVRVSRRRRARSGR